MEVGVVVDALVFLWLGGGQEAVAVGDRTKEMAALSSGHFVAIGSKPICGSEPARNVLLT